MKRRTSPRRRALSNGRISEGPSFQRVPSETPSERRADKRVLEKRPTVAFLTQLLFAIRSRFTRRARLEAENLLLRQQVIVLRLWSAKIVFECPPVFHSRRRLPRVRSLAERPAVVQRATPQVGGVKSPRRQPSPPRCRLFLHDQPCARVQLGGAGQKEDRNRRSRFSSGADLDFTDQ